MAHCFIMDFDGATAAQYDAVMRDMDIGGRLPAHALYHGAGSPDGRNWRVVDVWEEPQHFERFAAETIGPITARHGIGEPRITAFAIDEFLHGDPAPVTFMHVVRIPGMDAAGFAELNDALGPEPPAGLVMHGAGALGDGWAAIGVWTSKAARDRFMEEHGSTIVAAARTPAVAEDLELHNSLTEAAVGSKP